jgi:hypothetical protein
MSQPNLNLGSPWQWIQRSGIPGQTYTNTSRKGDIAELYICILATHKGAEVFRNLHCTGTTDLILRVGGNLYQIDVKLARKRAGAKGYRDDASRVQDPVYPLLVYPNGPDFADWKVGWKGTRYPQELKNFWKNESNTIGRC